MRSSRLSELSKSPLLNHLYVCSRSLLSIVAVHGLFGDQKDSWTHRKTNAFWLSDFLPQDVPNARVMTFGYNADAAFGNTAADIEDHAKSLLSGLIDKREEDDVDCQYSSPRDTKAEIFFLGTAQTYNIYRAFGRRNSD